MSGEQSLLSDRLKRKCRILIITVAFASVGSNVSKGQNIEPVSSTSNILTQAVQILNLPRESVLKSFPARIQGIVTCFDERSAVFFVQDQSAGIYIQALSVTNQLTAGDRVDISGVTGSGLFAPMIDATTVAVTGRGRLPDPRLAAIALRAGDHHFQAYVPKNSWLSSAWWPHVTGSLVKVIGIWIRETEGVHGTRPGGPMLLMQSSKDLFVKGPPPSKKSFFLIWTIAGVLLVFLLVYSWTVFVRKRIEKRTSSIRMQALAIEERFRDLFENANDIIYTHDLSGRITSINQGVERILGFSCDEILSRSIAALAAPRERGRVEEFIEDCIRGNTAREFQFEATAKSGDRVNLEITTRMQHQNGSVSGVQGIARDVTTKRNAEEALRRSEKQLRQSSEAQERLARDLHDNVIQSIYAVGLNLDDCRRTIGSDISHIDTRLAKVVAQLNAVIRDIRDFLSGLRPRSITGAEIEPALRSIATSFGDSFLKCVRFSIDPEAAEHLTSKQATQLLHIAREAISNSVRHAAAENTELSLIIIDGSITFEIRDDGVGFNSGKPKHEGSGLRNMADRARELGASFKLESQPGKGTRVSLEIPT